MTALLLLKDIDLNIWFSFSIISVYVKNKMFYTFLTEESEFAISSASFNI